MSEDKKKKMSPKGWLHKSTTKAASSAIGFIAAYREFLTTGELAVKTSPILDKLDNKEILPTPALSELQNVVMAHIVEVAARKQETSHAPSEPKTPTGSWVATVYNDKGEVATRIKENGEEETLSKGFDLSSASDRWCDRRLFEGGPYWYAEVVHSLTGIVTRIERADAIARILQKKKGPTVQVKGRSTKTLGFGVKCKQTRSSFSHG